MTRLGVALLTLFSSFSTKTSAEPLVLHDAPRNPDTGLSIPNVNQLKFTSPFHHPSSLGSQDLELLDTIIVASVDGKFHAVNRTSGSIQWSMKAAEDSDADDADRPSALSPLVRTNLTSFPKRGQGVNDDDEDDLETYVIEPQTGDIYVVPSHRAPNEALQKLGLSMIQLVEFSPFTLADPGHKKRQFLGSKETALLTIDILTGDIKDYVNSDRECKWERPTEEPFSLESYQDDELEGVTPQRSLTVSIARTDYTVNVRVGDRFVQRLEYSVYGPNNVDRATQAQWTQTPDDRYMQADPTGHLYAFSTSPQSRERNSVWQLPRFDYPVAAIFDIVTVDGRSDPIALLQPKPRIADVLPDSNAHYTRHSDRTYVGLVHDSLFAMSAGTYPLVSFVGEDRSQDMDVYRGGEHGRDNCADNKCLVGRWRTLDTSSSVDYSASFDRLIDAPSTSETKHDAGTIDSNQSTDVPRITEVPERVDYFKLRTATSKTLAPIFALGVAALLWLVVRSRPLSRMESEWKDNIPTPALTAPVVEVQPPTPVPAPLGEEPTAMIMSALTIATEPIASADGDDAKEADEEDKEDSGTPGGGKRKRVRKRTRKPRGGKPSGEPSGDHKDESPALAIDAPEENATGDHLALSLQLPTSPSPISRPLPVSLVVSETVLGFGSHGTIVYQGAFQGRAVAVKRLLGDFVTLATREVELLQESDDHPNVIRYFYKEQRDNFLYIALELCPASLADVVERPDVFREISVEFDPKKALAQVTAGLRHLHSLKIVHRDIKPQNILISHAKNGVRRMLISDFGLCKKLDSDQTSFMPTMHGAMAAGTVGWRAPEILRGDVKLDDQSAGADDSSRGSSSGSSPIAGTTAKRLTKSVDVFALGCLFYYTLTNGDHPFGDRFNRERNIMKNEFNVQELERLGEEGVEAMDLIIKMLEPEPKARPDTLSILLHPFFWTPGRRLNFLHDASDRFEIMCREPREEALITLERGALGVVGVDWHSRLDRIFIENLGKFRKYDGKTVQDLLRALRNKKSHYQDLPENVKRHLGPLPDGFLGYFTRRFPALFMHVHTVVSETGLAREPMFRSYFELAEG